MIIARSWRAFGEQSRADIPFASVGENHDDRLSRGFFPARRRTQPGRANAGISREERFLRRRKYAHGAAQSDRVGGSTNAVSVKLSSHAIFCMAAASNSEASGKTASEFPDNGSVVKTSTTVYEHDLVRVTGREPLRSGLSLHRIRTALALRQTRFGRACRPLQILGRAVPTRHSPQGAAP